MVEEQGPCDGVLAGGENSVSLSEWFQRATWKHHFCLGEGPEHPSDMTYGPIPLLPIPCLSISQQSSVRIYLQLLGISPKRAFHSAQMGHKVEQGWLMG